MLKLTDTHKGICRKGKGELNMNRKIEKLSCLTLTLMIVLSSVMVLSNVAAQTRPKIYIDPPVNEFFTDTTAVRDNFTVTIKASDWPDLYGYQLKFTYDSSVLQAVNAAIPAGDMFTPTIPGKVFVVDSGTITDGSVTFALSLLAPEPNHSGSGVIATVTLMIIAAPATGETLTSWLQLVDENNLIMVNPATGAGYPLDSFDNIPARFSYESPPPPTPTLRVSSKAWDNTAADAANRLFNITVSIENLVAEWHAIAFQFRLTFNGALIATKSEWVFAGELVTQFGATFSNATVTPNVFFGEIILPPWPDPNELDKWAHGSGALATIQFNATYRAPPAASCDLVLSEVVIIDYQGKDVPSNIAPPGTYTITVAPPPWMSVDPNTFTFKKNGDVLSLNVILNSVDKGFNLVGAEFKVRYDPTLLSITAAAIGEGDFMKDFATHAGTDTFFQAVVDVGTDYGLIGIIILPLPNGTWPEGVFPEGTGVLATLNFTAIGQQATQDVNGKLQVYDPLLVDVDAKTIPVDAAKTETEGLCTYIIQKAVPPFEGKIDIYTQYPDLYGGYGYHIASDGFAPQGTVQLSALVTYRGEPVPGKPVTFRVATAGPVQFGGDIIFATNFTDDEGIARWTLSVPAIPPNSNGSVWNVTASVDIAGNVVEDYVDFFVGWLIKVSSVTIAPVETAPVNGYQVVYKTRMYSMNVSLDIFTNQDPKNCLQMQGLTPKDVVAYTGRDELGQPIFAAFAELPIGAVAAGTIQPGHSRPFSDGLVTSIAIPKGAFTGKGDIQVNVLTDLPANNGVSIAPPYDRYVWIKKAP
jgi:hypothetical protein